MGSLLARVVERPSVSPGPRKTVASNRDIFWGGGTRDRRYVVVEGWKVKRRKRGGERPRPDPAMDQRGSKTQKKHGGGSFRDPPHMRPRARNDRGRNHPSGRIYLHMQEKQPSGPLRREERNQGQCKRCRKGTRPIYEERWERTHVPKRMGVFLTDAYEELCKGRSCSMPTQ